MREPEVALEGPVEFPRTVIARPDRAFVQVDRYQAVGVADFQPRPAPPPQVVRCLPRADAPDDGKHQLTARFEQTGAFARYIAKFRHTIQGAEVGVSSVIRCGV